MITLSSRVEVVIPALHEPYLNSLIKQLESYTVTVRSDQGLSYAVWKGINNSHAEIIAVMDADGSHPPGAIAHMVAMLDEHTHLVVGSKYCPGGYSHDSLPRKIVSLFYCALARLVLRTPIRDVMSGFWVGYKSAFQFQPTKSYKFGLQLIKRHNGHIAEYPIVFQKRKAGKSKVKPLQAISDLFSIIRRQPLE